MQITTTVWILALHTVLPWRDHWQLL